MFYSNSQPSCLWLITWYCGILSAFKGNLIFKVVLARVVIIVVLPVQAAAPWKVGLAKQIERSIETALYLGLSVHKGRLNRMQVTCQPTLALKSLGSWPLRIAHHHLPPGRCDWRRRGAFCFLFLTALSRMPRVEKMHQPRIFQVPSSFLFFSPVLFLPPYRKQNDIQRELGCGVTQLVTCLGGKDCLYVMSTTQNTCH